MQDKTFEMVPWGSNKDGHNLTKLSFESVTDNVGHCGDLPRRVL